ncbi:DUF1254 domain-containing protein [Hyphomicrobium sp. D-2]|uniref:DUF1254 domain-containing protein n=1 Tax=Hyphomicrobium sp. D-2 TaxID=3041621 RepID=UPI002455E3A1|nr:DUF1254 domain-containing protein [Hyphomicrobium sp. D-2]MDH4981198.1 DUF1254 domain-containing protein [Hyphomicrobium sp. D-2]
MKFVGTWALATFACCAPIASNAVAGATHFEGLADAPFVDGRPTAETAIKLQRELAFQQATQAYLWAMPLINTLGMKFGSDAAFGTGYNVLPIWKDRLDPKTLVTTPNSDVIYAMSYVDLSETGPLVFDAPSDMQGILLDFWQRPIPVDGGKYFGDVGFAGPDHGKGGKFLILPPGYDGDVPEGYFVYRSGTNNIFIFLRSFFKDPKNLAPAVELIERSQIYPLNSTPAERKPMQFPNASGVPADMLPRSDFSAFEQLKWLVDREGKHLASADGLGLLANVGLIAGKPFKPDAATKSMLNAAAKTAYKTSRVIGLQDGIAGESYKVWADRQWINPVNNAKYPGPEKPSTLAFENKAGGFYEIEPRVWFFTNYYSISPGMVSQKAGQGAAYEIAFNDADGKPLLGKHAYKVTLPPNIPAEIFWSLTLYNAANASGLPTAERRFPSLGSRDNPKFNADGSIDLYIGPNAPEGKEDNWLPTAADKGFFAILRLYGPKESAIDYSWKPGDFERQ